MYETTEKTPVMEAPVINETPTNGTEPKEEERTWIEEIEIAGDQLVNRVKELIAEGNVRRLILRTQDDKLILEIPLTAGALLGGAVTLFAPVLAALGALAALIARIKVQIVREGEPKE
jgi:hypothetical protein